MSHQHGALALDDRVAHQRLHALQTGTASCQRLEPRLQLGQANEQRDIAAVDLPGMGHMRRRMQHTCSVRADLKMARSADTLSTGTSPSTWHASAPMGARWTRLLGHNVHALHAEYALVQLRQIHVFGCKLVVLKLHGQEQAAAGAR